MADYGLLLYEGPDRKSWLFSPTGQEAFQALPGLVFQTEGGNAR